VYPGRAHAQGNAFCAGAERKTRRLHRRLPAPHLLRLHRPAHADRVARQPRAVARHAADHRRGLRRKIRWIDPGRARVWARLARSGAVLARVATAIVGSGAEAGRIIAINLRRPVDHEAFRSGLDEAIEPRDRPELAPLINEAAQHKTLVEAISFVTREPASDI